MLFHEAKQSLRWPIFSGIVQLPLIPVIQKFPLKNCLLANCVINMGASVMYALAAVSGSVATLFVARALMGSVGGPVWCTTYVVRTTGLKTRSTYMLYVGLGIGLGYGLGPLLALTVEAVCNAAEFDAPAMDSSTAPGWLMVVLFGIEMLCLGALMEEPPKLVPTPGGGGGGASGGATPALPYARLAA